MDLRRVAQEPFTLGRLRLATLGLFQGGSRIAAESDSGRHCFGGLGIVLGLDLVPDLSRLELLAQLPADPGPLASRAEDTHFL
jgi:hypothetical protein